MARVVQATPADYSVGASSARDYVANALQVLQDVIEDVRAREGEPFIVGMQDDLMGIRVRLTRALNILDAR